MEMFFLFPVVIWLIGMAYLVYGIVMAVDAAKTEQWVWFVLILVFMFPAAILYHVMAKGDGRGESSHAMRRRIGREAEMRREIDELRAKVDRLQR